VIVGDLIEYNDKKGQGISEKWRSGLDLALVSVWNFTISSGDCRNEPCTRTYAGSFICAAEPISSEVSSDSCLKNSWQMFVSLLGLKNGHEVAQTRRKWSGHRCENATGDRDEWISSARWWIDGTVLPPGNPRDAVKVDGRVSVPRPATMRNNSYWVCGYQNLSGVFLTASKEYMTRRLTISKGRQEARWGACSPPSIESNHTTRRWEFILEVSSFLVMKLANENKKIARAYCHAQITAPYGRIPIKLVPLCLVPRGTWDG